MIDLYKGKRLEENVDWCYMQGATLGGLSLRMYKSEYYGVEIYKQIESRYDTRTGFALNKPVKSLFFTDDKGVEFKTLFELQDYIRCCV